MFIRIDAIISSYFPIVAAGYFIWNESYFSGHIYFVCWIAMVVNMSFTLETYEHNFTRRTSITSLTNLLVFGLASLLGFISATGFLLSILIADSVSIIIAFVYFFFFKKGVDQKRAWKTFGISGTIVYILLFTAAVYPYVGEWVLYMNSDFEFVVLFAVLIGFSSSISRKIAIVAAAQERIMKKKNKIRENAKPISGFKPQMPMNVSAHILVSLGFWLFGLGVLYFITNNAS